MSRARGWYHYIKKIFISIVPTRELKFLAEQAPIMPQMWVTTCWYKLTCLAPQKAGHDMKKKRKEKDGYGLTHYTNSRLWQTITISSKLNSYFRAACWAQIINCHIKIAYGRVPTLQIEGLKKILTWAVFGIELVTAEPWVRCTNHSAILSHSKNK